MKKQNKHNPLRLQVRKRKAKYDVQYFYLIGRLKPYLQSLCPSQCPCKSPHLSLSLSALSLQNTSCALLQTVFRSFTVKVTACLVQAAYIPSVLMDIN